MGKTKILTINTPQKDFRIVSMDVDALEELRKFYFGMLIKCPKYRRRSFVKSEGDAVELIPNVRRTKSLFCYSICSGLRGDGSRYKERCLHFVGYNARQVVCKLSPSGLVNIKEYTSCPRLERIVRVGVNKAQIELWGSGDLSNVSRDVCENCEYFWKGRKSCTFKTGCDNSIIATMNCTSLDCGECARGSGEKSDA